MGNDKKIFKYGNFTLRLGPKEGEFRVQIGKPEFKYKKVEDFYHLINFYNGKTKVVGEGTTKGRIIGLKKISLPEEALDYVLIKLMEEYEPDFQNFTKSGGELEMIINFGNKNAN